MSKPLFTDELETCIARQILQNYRGREINPMAPLDFEIRLDDGSIYDPAESRQPKNVMWLIKKMIAFRSLCVYELLKKVRDFDENYYNEMLHVNSLVGPKAVTIKDVIPGTSSCKNSEYSEEEVYLNRKYDIEQNHREAMKSVDYYFKIADFVYYIATLLTEKNPDLAEFYFGIFGGKKIEAVLSQFLNSVNEFDETNEIHLKAQIYKNCPEYKKDAVNGVRHLYDVKTRKANITIKFVDLTDEEIEEFISFMVPNATTVPNVQAELFKNYVSPKLLRKAEPDVKEMNTEIWRKFRKVQEITHKKWSGLFDVYHKEYGGVVKVISMHPPIKLKNGKTVYFMGYEDEK